MVYLIIKQLSFIWINFGNTAYSCNYTPQFPEFYKRRYKAILISQWLQQSKQIEHRKRISPFGFGITIEILQFADLTWG